MNSPQTCLPALHSESALGMTGRDTLAYRQAGRAQRKTKHLRNTGIAGREKLNNEFILQAFFVIFRVFRG